MKVSHECPLSLLEESRNFNDYCYALVHLFPDHPQYYNFFAESLHRYGRKVILDNSIFELGTAYEPEEFVKWILRLRPTEYIIPDTLEDSASTVRNGISFTQAYPDLPGKSIGVVQGKSYDDIVWCYRNLDKGVGVDKIAISFDYSYYQSLVPSENKYISFMLGRITLINMLLRDRVINLNKPHHLLGAALPQEFTYYKGMDFIESVDTSSPVVHAIKGIRYNDWGLLNKESQKLVDLFNTKEDSINKETLYYNLTKFKEFAQ